MDVICFYLKFIYMYYVPVLLIIPIISTLTKPVHVPDGLFIQL